MTDKKKMPRELFESVLMAVSTSACIPDSDNNTCEIVHSNCAVCWKELLLEYIDAEGETDGS